jgi:hypothetical protein
MAATAAKRTTRSTAKNRKVATTPTTPLKEKGELSKFVDNTIYLGTNTVEMITTTQNVYITTMKLVQDSLGEIRLNTKIDLITDLRAKGFSDEEIEILCDKYLAK